MLLKARSYFYVFWLLLKTDLLVLKKNIIGKIINVLCWSSSIVIVSTFILTKLGMTEKYGEFIAVSAIASQCWWGIWDSAYWMLADIEDKKVIDYKFALPMSSWLVLVQYAVRHAIYRLLPSLIILPFFKIILGSRMNLSNFSFFKFSLMFITISLFTGFFYIFVSSFVKNSSRVDTIGIRLLFPIWFFGASQNSWWIMHSVNSKIAYGILLNPWVYAMEGMHSAVLGPKGYLPFWVCFAVLWVCIFGFGLIGILRFKKRLDFV